ncbi:MAG: RNA polymerase sigma factor [bacterium]|nr:RNA polymerase sigma factor [bacterium]
MDAAEIAVKQTAEIAVNKTQREGGAFAPPACMDYSSLSDSQLIVLVSNQDNKAFKELFDRYSRMVFNLSYSYVTEFHAAEDISQEVFLTIFTKGAEFKFKSSFSTWIYRITVNASISYLRKHKKDARLTNLEDAADVEDEGSDKQKERDSKREALALKALDMLPENQKTAFILSQKESLKYKEIASIMNVSEKAVESMIYRARENIKNNLKKLQSKKISKERE